MSKAQELADQLQSAVQTYPQMSEDEPGGYCNQVDELMDCAAAELRRLDAERAELANCLKECMSAVEVFHGPVAWDIYRDHSPEMKRWRAALSSSGGNES